MNSEDAVYQDPYSGESDEFDKPTKNRFRPRGRLHGYGESPEEWFHGYLGLGPDAAQWLAKYSDRLHAGAAGGRRVGAF